MNVEFQENILRYCLQNERAKYYIKNIPVDIFDSSDHKLLFDLAKKYYFNYDAKPTEANLKHFFEIKSNFDPQANKKVNDLISKYFLPFGDDWTIVEDEVIDYAKKKLIRKLFVDQSMNLDTVDDAYYKRLISDINRIANLKSESSDTSNTISLLHGDHSFIFDTITGHPCIFKAINDMTSAGGFLPPELILFLAGPKAFKTGIQLEIAVGYIISGLNVFYADFENGSHNLMRRVRQKLGKATRSELGDTYSGVEQIIGRMKDRGCGDLMIHKFKGEVDSMDDVESILDALEVTKNFKPDVIIYDYLDIVATPKKDRREGLQYNYHRAISINESRKCFSFSVSRMTADGFNKERAKLSDFGDDKTKAYNCHAAFHISRTEKDIEMGYGRIYALAQREGRPASDECCYLKIDAARQIAEEVFADEFPVELSNDNY